MEFFYSFYFYSLTNGLFASLQAFIPPFRLYKEFTPKFFNFSAALAERFPERQYTNKGLSRCNFLMVSIFCDKVSTGKLFAFIRIKLLKL